MSTGTPNERSGVDAGWTSLLVFRRLGPRHSPRLFAITGCAMRDKRYLPLWRCGRAFRLDLFSQPSSVDFPSLRVLQERSGTRMMRRMSIINPDNPDGEQGSGFLLCHIRDALGPAIDVQSLAHFQAA